MGETVGFRSALALIQPHLIKRDALMFNRIAVFGCDKVNEEMPDIFKENFPEIPWLTEQGVLFEPTIDHTGTIEPRDEETQNSFNSALAFIEKYEDDIKKVVNNEEKILRYLRQMQEIGVSIPTKQLQGIRGMFNLALMSNEIFLRPLSTYYRNIRHIDAIPIISGKLPKLPQQTGSKEEVIKVAINHLPIPDESTSWEQIIDFRNDPDSGVKFRRFRHWMNEIAKSTMPPIEIEQKLEYLLDEYRKHMELHFKKTNTSTWETIIVSLGNRMFGDIVKGMFSVKHRQIALLEAEAKAPGREIAFISKAQETFR
jgi:hypothetical protein